MGVMSRRVLPACGQLCVLCPSLRARSRQPVKRYKKLLTEIFPKSSDGGPNERMVGKLCDYVSKNPMRLPEITQYLEQRCYKELRNRHFAIAKVVPLVYRRFLASCKEHMPLYATSLISIIRTLLDQSQHYEMQILGCCTLVDFLKCQTDGTYMSSLEGLVPKLCQLAQEFGENDRGLWMRSAGLQALAYMVFFMGEHSHIINNFDDIVSVTLLNYEAVETILEDDRQDQQADTQGYLVQHGQNLNIPISNNEKKVPSDISVETKNPAYWSLVCLQNMSHLCKEATTMRRIFEPIFQYLDNYHLWSPQRRFSVSVLYEGMKSMDNSAQSSNLLLSILIKHLDHKNVARQHAVQVDIIKVTTHLAKHVKSHSQSSLATVTAICDLLRHLRKCLQYCIEMSDLVVEEFKGTIDLVSAIEQCLLLLAKQAGDVGSILDTMAIALENISMTPAVSRSTISAIYLMATISVSLPNIIYNQKAFPEALLHQLLSAMNHPDYETRVASHRLFSAVLIPKCSFPWSFPLFMSRKANGHDDTLLVALSCLPSARVILEKMNLLVDYSQYQRTVTEEVNELAASFDDHRNAKELSSNLSQAISDGVFTELRNDDLRNIRLSSHQVGLLLSSVWTQATYPGNTPSNYEAISNTFHIIILFSQFKASSHVALVRCFQVAFSLRRLSLDSESCLLPFCRRSLFTLSSSMLILCATSGHLSDLVPLVKTMCMSQMDDPHFILNEDGTLQSINEISLGSKIIYSSDEDAALAREFLSMLRIDDQEQLREMVVSNFLKTYKHLSEAELSIIKEKLMQQYSPDDTFPHGLQVFMETSRPSSSMVPMENGTFNVMIPFGSSSIDDFLERNAGQSDQNISEPAYASDILNVNQLMESVLEAARQVASLPVLTTPVPYTQMKSQCEALVIAKQQKMSVLRNFNSQLEEASQNGTPQGESKDISAIPRKQKHCPDPEKEQQIIESDAVYHENENSFRLPPSSPYDKFMKAAGC